MHVFLLDPDLDVTFWTDLLLKFIPEPDEPDLYGSRHPGEPGGIAYVICAKALYRINELPYMRRAFEDITPKQKDPYDQYGIFAKEVAEYIWETENLDACTYKAIRDRYKKKIGIEEYPENTIRGRYNKSRIEEYPENGVVDLLVDDLIKEMIFLGVPYNFLPDRMSRIQDKEDLGLFGNLRVLLQRHGLFEEENQNAPRGINLTFQGEVPTADCLCDLLGVEIDWTLSLADHLKFDEPKRQLTLFRLPSFCEVNLRSPKSVPRRPVLLGSCI